MADYTTLADSTFQEGAPARGIDIKALRDNIVAVTEGASGAPKVQNAALDSNSVTAAKIAGSAVTNAKLGSSAVTNAKIANGTIAVGKLNASSFTHYAVGTYILAKGNYSGSEFSYTPGSSVPASRIPGVSSGTWRNMGSDTYSYTSEEGLTSSLLLRIA